MSSLPLGAAAQHKPFPFILTNNSASSNNNIKNTLVVFNLQTSSKIRSGRPDAFGNIDFLEEQLGLLLLLLKA